VTVAPTLPRKLPFGFFPGSSTTPEVPGKWPCALNGRPLMIDDGNNSVYQWMHQGIEQIRTQADSSTAPSEASLNPAGLWRRAQESWHRGAGQAFRDRTNADEFRFSASKGVNVWETYELSLLPATDQKLSGASTNYRLAVAGTRLYVADGSSLKYTTDVTVDSPTWNTVTGYSGASILDLCSDGYTVYFTDGANVWTTNTGIGAASSTNTLDATHVGFVKGRLMASKDNKLWNITTVGTDPVASPIFTHFNADFEFVGFAQGQSAIYTAGYSGDKSQVYKITVKNDGTGLDAPSEAGEIPDGEVVTSIGDYLGFIIIGTTDGFRFCEPDSSGNLTIGPLVDLGASVLCFEGQKRFVWFGWTGYDVSSTGLGRMDLTQFTADVVTGGRAPAYASDLMATTTGAVLSAATFQDLRVFTVSGHGVYAETTTYVSSGTVTSGQIGFGLPDEKVAIELAVLTEPLLGSYSASLTVDSGTPVTVGTASTATTTSSEFPLTYSVGRLFEVTVTLMSGNSNTQTPVVSRWTLKASPGANDGPAEILVIPFLLYHMIDVPWGEPVPCDVKEERDRIKRLRETRVVVPFQDVDTTYQVIVENYEWHPSSLAYSSHGGYATENGTLVTQLKRLN
jgi:hypothetical protein